MQKAIDSEKGTLQVVTIECGSGSEGAEKTKPLTYGPLAAQLGRNKIDVVWCEVAPLKVGADGAKSLPEGISLISEFQKVNEGEVSFVFFLAPIGMCSMCCQWLKSNMTLYTPIMRQ